MDLGRVAESISFWWAMRALTTGSGLPDVAERYTLRWDHGMSTSGIELREVAAQNVTITDDALVAHLADGRTITVPLAWFPRLLNGTTRERSDFRLISSGSGIHWPDLDEDISVASLLAGRRSGETQESLRRWLESRRG
jgi:hypothetical protein